MIVRDLSNRGLTTLEGIDLFGVGVLNCCQNSLTSLPRTLPKSLKYVYCADNSLISVPVIPDGIVLFDCTNNKLTNLPVLPNSLMYLNCGGNNFRSLPALDNKLRVLNCRNNKLVSLPILPKNLQSLDCSYNNLTYIPNLPDSLVSLNCENNKLSSLPIISPFLSSLCYRNNGLYEFNIDEILLRQHNQKRWDLGLEAVEEIEGDEDIRHRWMLLQYDLDSEEYKKAEREMKN